MENQFAKSLYARRAGLYEAMIRVIGHERALHAALRRGGLVREDSKVLDAGCGTGVLSFAVDDVAKKRGLKRVSLFGFDLTPTMLQRFRSRAATRGLEASFMNANVMDVPECLPKDWKDFTLVVSSGMLEYLPKPSLPLALRKLAALLAPDGRMLVFISRNGWFNRLFIGGYWRANLYGREEILEAFEEAGCIVLNIRDHKSWGYMVEARSVLS